MAKDDAVFINNQGTEIDRKPWHEFEKWLQVEINAAALSVMVKVGNCKKTVRGWRRHVFSNLPKNLRISVCLPFEILEDDVKEVCVRAMTESVSDVVHGHIPISTLTNFHVPSMPPSRVTELWNVHCSRNFYQENPSIGIVLTVIGNDTILVSERI